MARYLLTLLFITINYIISQGQIPSRLYSLLSKANLDSNNLIKIKLTKQEDKKRDSIRRQKRTLDWILYYDFHTSLSGLHSINIESPQEQNNIYFYYNVDLKNKLTLRNITWDLYLFNDYGLHSFFDSITIKTQDQFTFKNGLYFPLYTKRLNFSISTNTETRLWNSYKYRINNMSEKEKYYYEGFMNPGIIFYSGGLTYCSQANISIQIGLGSSKVTKLIDQRIFTSRQENLINGLEKGQRKKSEIGLNLTATVPLQKISNKLHWEFYGNLFYPTNQLIQIKSCSMDINNVIHIVLLKYVRISWRTKFNYCLQNSPRPMLQNILSIGFYLCNHL